MIEEPSTLSSGHSTFSGPPPEIVARILLFLELSNWLTCARINRRWYELILKEACFWASTKPPRACASIQIAQDDPAWLHLNEKRLLNIQKRMIHLVQSISPKAVHLQTLSWWQAHVMAKSTGGRGLVELLMPLFLIIVVACLQSFFPMSFYQDSTHQTLSDERLDEKKKELFVITIGTLFFGPLLFLITGFEIYQDIMHCKQKSYRDYPVSYLVPDEYQAFLALTQKVSQMAAALPLPEVQSPTQRQCFMFNEYLATMMPRQEIRFLLETLKFHLGELLRLTSPFFIQHQLPQIIKEYKRKPHYQFPIARTLIAYREMVRLGEGAPGLGRQANAVQLSFH